MIGQKFVILFVSGLGFITPDNGLTADKLDVGHIGKYFKAGTYWIIEILHYKPEKKQLIASLYSSGFGNMDFTTEQFEYKDLLDEIESIHFTRMNTSDILQTIQSFAHQVTSSTTTQEPMIAEPLTSLAQLRERIEAEKAETKPESIPEVTQSDEPKPIYILDTFDVNIKDLHFEYGKVNFKRFFPQVNKKLELSLFNEFLREEFDAIKNYFEKILNTKKVTVTVTVEYQNGTILKAETNSPQIDLINQGTIEQIRFSYVKETIRKRQRIDSNKTIFTMEELFDELSDATLKASAFYQHEKELAEDLVKITASKHYKNLRFLSDKHDSHTMKLRFSIKPFSFILLVNGKEQYHLVWETLDTEEATYIWPVGNDVKHLPVSLEKIVETISCIKVQGKRAYLSSSDDEYTRVYHQYNQGIEGFYKWKDEVEAALY